MSRLNRRVFKFQDDSTAVVADLPGQLEIEVSINGVPVTDAAEVDESTFETVMAAAGTRDKTKLRKAVDRAISKGAPIMDFSARRGRRNGDTRP